MTIESAAKAQVKQAVPFLGVTNMEASLRFYTVGLGFEMRRWWIPDDQDGDYEHDGRVRWCWLQRGDAAVMLQEFLPERLPKETLGTGISINFMCEDALALYREFKSRGIQTRNRPSVGNGLWVVSLNDPDGYHLEFASPTDAPEESELEE
jgi:lactoylglutathione lyase